MNIFIILFVIFIGLGFTFVNLSLLKKTKQINQEVEKQNEEIDTHNKYLLKENSELNKLKEELQITINSLIDRKNDISSTVDDKQTELNNILNQINNQQVLSKDAFENYCEILEKQYKTEEKDYEESKELLRKSYEDLQLKFIKETEKIQKDLDKISATRAAAIQAQVKEKAIEENMAFYSLEVTNSDLRDIGVLESIKPKLNNSRILSMLIWQTFFRTPMTNLCNKVVGKETKTGIYKITNQKTKECYIGQAVDISSRWKDHAKAGLGIDTPAGNKLYKAIQEYGIQNFSWEIIEECPKDQLNEKEKYYIELYQSKDYGYNSNKGISKK